MEEARERPAKGGRPQWPSAANQRFDHGRKRQYSLLSLRTREVYAAPRPRSLRSLQLASLYFDGSAAGGQGAARAARRVAGWATTSDRSRVAGSAGTVTVKKDASEIAGLACRIPMSGPWRGRHAPHPERLHRMACPGWLARDTKSRFFGVPALEPATRSTR